MSAPPAHESLSWSPAPQPAGEASPAANGNAAPGAGRGASPAGVASAAAARVVEVINLSSSANTLLKNRVLAMRARGIDCRIICIDGPQVKTMRDLGIPVHTVHLPRGHNVVRALQAMFEIMAYLRKERIHLVHTHCSVPGFVGRIAGRLAGVPVVMHTVHGFHFHENSTPVHRALYVRLERFAGWFTDMLLSQNRSDLEEARATRIVPSDRMCLIGNGIDLKAFRPSRDGETGISPPVITCVARFEPVKNHRMLFDAVRLMKEQGTRFQLWLVGDGPLRAEYEQLCGTLGIADEVRFLGYRDDMPALLARTDVAALPSLKEGIPRAVLEPMGMGVPVVATRVVGTREAVRDGETGYLVPLGDSAAMAAALTRLIEDPELRRDLGRRGREVALAEFDESTIVDRLIVIYRNLLTNRGIEAQWPTAASTPS